MEKLEKGDSKMNKIKILIRGLFIPWEKKLYVKDIMEIIFERCPKLLEFLGLEELVFFRKISECSSYMSSETKL